MGHEEQDTRTKERAPFERSCRARRGRAWGMWETTCANWRAKTASQGRESRLLSGCSMQAADLWERAVEVMMSDTSAAT
jgi:hypothetical protein